MNISEINKGDVVLAFDEDNLLQYLKFEKYIEEKNIFEGILLHKTKDGYSELDYNQFHICTWPITSIREVIRKEDLNKIENNE